MKFRVIILALLAFIGPISLSAQRNSSTRVEQYIDSLKKSHRITYIGEGEKSDSIDERVLLDIFYYDQFRHAQDPRTPYFLFMSRDARFAMGIGGVVRMRTWYDWNGAMPNNGFIPYNIAIPYDPAHARWLGFTPAGTALYFRMLGRNASVGDYQLYIEANFNGYNQRDFLLKKAYVTLNDWTVGYASSTFSDPSVEPVLVDGQGPNGYISTTTVLVRWMHTFKQHWVVATSIEMPQSFVDGNDSTTQNINDWIPNLAAFVQYEWGDNQHIRLAGLVRTLPYRNLVTQSNDNVFGWGVRFSSILRPCKPLSVYLMANYGRGISSFTGDLIMGRYDLINQPNSPGNMYTPELVGWYGALQYHFTPQIFSTVTFGMLHYFPLYEATPNQYKNGMYGAANLFWNITPRIQIGGEYNFGRRMNVNKESRWGQRASVMCQFSF